MPIEATLTIAGIAELKDALGKLPAELKGQATQIVLDTAYAAAEDVREQYPLGPGTSKRGRAVPPGQLKKGVKVFIKEVGPFAVLAQVRSTSPHAWWHEHGSELKPRETKKGWSRGTMFGVKGIPRPVFVPTMIRHRRWMYQKLAALIASTGLTVKHDEAA
jgi:hypothetical protein